MNHGAQNNFDVNQSLSWIKGSHTFKFGFEYLKMMSNAVSSQGDSGSFNFSRSGTALPGSLTGQWMASLLLGRADYGEVRVYSSASYERSGYYAGYAQDDFKVTPRFTLNMGLRYDLYRPTVDKFNHLAWMDRTAPNPALGGFPGTMIFATPDRRTGVDQYNKGFAPRFGVAYRFSDKTGPSLAPVSPVSRRDEFPNKALLRRNRTFDLSRPANENRQALFERVEFFGCLYLV